MKNENRRHEANGYVNLRRLILQRKSIDRHVHRRNIRSHHAKAG